MATVYGVPGASLDNSASWASTSRKARTLGRLGEQRCAEILGALPNQIAVIHDLKIPIKRRTANVDHAVVTGSDVYLFDAKVWQPGFYWTLAGTTRRGWSTFKPAASKTFSTAVPAFQAAVPTATFHRPTVVVFPSNNSGGVHVRWMRMADATVTTEAGLRRLVDELASGVPADPVITSRLVAMIPTPR